MALTSSLVPLGTPALLRAAGRPRRAHSLSTTSPPRCSSSSSPATTARTSDTSRTQLGTVRARTPSRRLVAICSNDVDRYPDDAPSTAGRSRPSAAGWRFPYLVDADQIGRASAYGAVCTPDFFVYGPDRRLAYRGAFDAVHARQRRAGHRRDLRRRDRPWSPRASRSRSRTVPAWAAASSGCPETNRGGERVSARRGLRRPLRGERSRSPPDFENAGLPARAARGLAVLTCMDSRIDPFDILGIGPGDAKVLRNAGGRVTEDVLRTLVLGAYLLDVDRVLVMPHTKCAMAGFTEDEIHAKIRDGARRRHPEPGVPHHRRPGAPHSGTTSIRIRVVPLAAAQTSPSPARSSTWTPEPEPVTRPAECTSVARAADAPVSSAPGTTRRRLQSRRLYAPDV